MCVNLKTFNESFRHWHQEQDEQKPLGWAFNPDLTEEDSQVSELENDGSETSSHKHDASTAGL